MGVVKVEIPVSEETAAALTDPRQRAALGRLVELLVRPGEANDPLISLLEATAHEAAAAGLSQQDVADELAAWKAEHAARRS